MEVLPCTDGIPPEILKNRENLIVTGVIEKNGGSQVTVTYRGRDRDKIYAYQLFWSPEYLEVFKKVRQMPKDRILLLRVPDNSKSPRKKVTKDLIFSDHSPEKKCFIIYDQLIDYELSIVTQRVSRCILS